MKPKHLIIPVIFLLSCSSSPHFFLRESEKFPLIKKVAVLPFKNITNRSEAGKVITNIFIHELFNRNIYNIEEMGIIRNFFVRQRIRTKGEIDLDTVSMLGGQLGIDAVFLGVVEEYYQEAAGKGVISPKIGLSVRMLSAKDGAILWKCYHHREGDDYIIILNLGKVRSIDLLAQKMIREMIDTIQKHGKI